VSIVIDIAAQFTGKKAFAQAENAADKLGRSVKHALIGVGVTAFAKSAISAFAAQEKQLALFSNSLRQIGFDFATSDSLAFLNSLKLQYGVVDSQLLPAYQQLLTTTRSLAASQNLTNIALDIAARQNISVTQAADALSKAYLGNTKSVGALDLGISKATLASGDFYALLKEITTITKGAAAAGADTFSNKLARLKVAADLAKVSIGAGLVEALMQISNSTSIDELQVKIINFGKSAAETLSNIGTLISENIVLIKSFAIILAAAFTVNKIASFIIALEAIVKTVKTLRNALLASAIARNFLFSPLGAAALTAGMFAAIGLAIKGVEKLSDSSTKAKDNLSNLFSTMGVSGFTDSLNLYGSPASNAAAKVAKDQKAAAAAQLKATKAQTKAAQDQAKLKKANTLFDIDQVQIMAALQNKLTEDEKLRLTLQLALLQGNASEAERLGKQLAISQLQTTNLAIAIANIPAALNPFKGWGSEIDNLLAKLIDMYKLLGQKPADIIATQATNGVYGIGAVGGLVRQREYDMAASVTQISETMQPDYLSYRAGERGDTVVNNYVINGATQGLIEEVRNGLLVSSASGSFSLSNRATRGD